MFSTAWLWLVAKFGLAKLIGTGAIVVAVAAFTGGIWLKGYASCDAKHQLAAKDALIRDLMKDIQDQQDAMEFGQRLADVMNKVEAENDQNAPSIVGDVNDSTPVLDAGFVHRLGKLR